jgi:hypothetical protein
MLSLTIHLLKAIAITVSRDLWAIAIITHLHLSADYVWQ